ncbi:sulfurtransferase [Natrarchaeobaculum aegyptiacum]|uniref:Sulfurtransferase n=1 Tax=Natrarchaeobaculum aegyptiacum TaxID=745377 RepID=A0A2Z2HUK5_9EURY|nr:sulfurtransferase [Natrarchaeobaculum aegyptiacum]ARS90463.1 sulfurtransferase [Natrarchaeobaculum aegyptiacum]
MTDYDTDVLVSADWVEDRLDDFQSDDPAYRLVEIESPSPPDNDFPSLYDEGHIPGAIGLNWDDDLSDDDQRDILKKEDFEDLVGEIGIGEDSTVVFYGDGHVPNWFAVFAYWQFNYYGHEDTRILDGGKDYWVENDYPLTEEQPDYPSQEYEARGPFESIRAYQGEVDKAREAGLPMVDVRSPEEFSGELIAPPELDETAQRGGHIPGASNVPVPTNLQDDGRFLPPEELRDLYEEAGIDGDESVVTYCRVGERSAIAWFALHELLGYEDVQNYDGSWTEWGNLIRAPIAKGEDD